MFSANLQAKMGGPCPVGAQGTWALHFQNSLCIKALHGPYSSEPHVDLQIHKAIGFLSPDAGRWCVCECVYVYICVGVYMGPRLCSLGAILETGSFYDPKLSKYSRQAGQ